MKVDVIAQNSYYNCLSYDPWAELIFVLIKNQNFYQVMDRTSDRDCVHISGDE